MGPLIGTRHWRRVECEWMCISRAQSDESHMEISLDTAPALLRSAILSKGRGVCLGMGGGSEEGASYIVLLSNL